MNCSENICATFWCPLRPIAFFCLLLICLAAHRYADHITVYCCSETRLKTNKQLTICLYIISFLRFDHMCTHTHAHI
jgi:hypothetical protein